MRRLRKIVGNLLAVAASIAITLLALELVLRLLPVAWAPPLEEPTAAHPIQRWAPNTPFTWSMGWDFAVVVHGRTNAQGFVANYDYDTTATMPLVAVVGDSFVEALMVPFAQTLTGRLQAMLGSGGRAYAFAQFGSPLSQYVAYARHACALYRPERLVVVVVGNDFDESLYSHRFRDGIHHLHPQPGGGFDLKLSPPAKDSLAKRMLRRSALALYLGRNVGAANLLRHFAPAAAKAETRQPNGYVGNTSAAADGERLADGERVIAWFLAALPQAACLPARHIAIVVDGIRPQLYDDGASADAGASYFGHMRAALISRASAEGFMVVDMERHFRADYAVHRLRFEFATDGHWNAHAHAVATAAVREALAGWPPLASAAND